MRLIVVIFCFVCSLWGQESKPMSKSLSKPIETNFCDLWQHPERYVGQMVRFRAEVHFIRHYFIRDNQCGPVGLNYPSYPDVNPKPSFELLKNNAYDKVTKSHHVMFIDPETGERKGTILATMEGRFDSVFSLDKKGKVVRKGKGFGHLGLYDNRLVLQSFEDVCVISPGGDSDCVPLEE